MQHSYLLLLIHSPSMPKYCELELVESHKEASNMVSCQGSSRIVVLWMEEIIPPVILFVKETVSEEIYYIYHHRLSRLQRSICV